MDNEKKIEQLMRSLELSREEAIALMKADEEVDRMTKTSEIDSDLNDEQKKAMKKAKQGDRKPTVYKFDSKRKKADNPTKQRLIAEMVEALESIGATAEILNAEREFKFTFDGTTYKIVMSVPRG